MEASLEEGEPSVPTFAASVWLGEALKREGNRKASHWKKKEKHLRQREYHGLMP